MAKVNHKLFARLSNSPLLTLAPFMAIFLLVFSLSATITPVTADSPPTDSKDVDLSLTLTPVIGLSLDFSVVNIPVTPTPTGALSVRHTTASVYTNHPGYSLTVQANSGNTTFPSALVDITAPTTTTLASQTIAPSTNTTPAILANNTWGIATPTTTDGTTPIAGLPDGSTSGETNLTAFQSSYHDITNGKIDDNPNQGQNGNAPSPEPTFLAPPTSSSPLTLRHTSTTTSNDTTDIYYGVKATNAQTSGTYRTIVTYTVTGEPIPEPPTCKSGNESDNFCQVDLDANMIPIKYTGNTTTPQWSKASPTEADGGWYDYDNQKWANAVTVKAAGGTKTLAEYQAAAVDTVIAEDDILGYFVYVPRYQYQVQRFSPSNPPSCGPAATNNQGGVAGNCSEVLSEGKYGPRNFNIQFQKSTDPISVPTQTGDWATHPAFTSWTAANGGAGLNGLWVGKFETTGASGALTIKPNQTSLRSQNVSLQFDQAKRIGAIDSTAESYGASAYLNNAGTATIPQNQHNLTTAKSHMFTNSDWGAVIYLATSAYGAGDKTYADGTNLNDYGVVGKNANSDYVTGCGRYDSHSDASSYAGTTTCKRTTDHDRSYFSTVGLESSTTSNVYGVYDMVGGALEYTMSNYNSTNNSANFSTMPNAPYINKYLTGDGFVNDTYANFQQCTWATCGGQGLYETTFVASVSSNSQSWSRDDSYFVYSYNSWVIPWALRGGGYSPSYGSGLFYSYFSTGGVSDYGFRVGAGIF